MDEEQRSEAVTLVKKIYAQLETRNDHTRDIRTAIRMLGAFNAEYHAKAAHSLEHLEKALKNPDAHDFDIAVATAADMLRADVRLPDWLASFTADVLEGKRKRPTRRGPDPDAKFLRDYTAAYAVSLVSGRFNVPAYTNNVLSEKATAADIVAEATGIGLQAVIKAYRKFSGGGTIPPLPWCPSAKVVYIEFIGSLTLGSGRRSGADDPKKG